MNDEDYDLVKELRKDIKNEVKQEKISSRKKKIIFLVILIPIILAGAIVGIYFLTKNEDTENFSEKLTHRLTTITFPSGVLIDDGHYLFDGKIFVCYKKEDDKDMTFFGVISDDSTNFKQLYRGNITVSKKANGIRLIPFRDGKKVYLGDWIFECKDKDKNVSDCPENEGELIDVKYPEEVANNSYTYKTWSEMVVAPDNVHVAWTSLNMACGAINFLGKFEKGTDSYNIVDSKIISTIDFLTVDENNPNYLITHTPRGGEIKQFIEGGNALSLVGTMPDTFVKSVYQSLVNEDHIGFSHATGYDETSILSPDEKLGITMSTRFSPNTSMAVLGFMPRPYCSLALSKITESVYTYSISGVRKGRNGNIGPVLFDVEKSINEADYQGIDLHDQKEKFVFCSPISWHPSNLKALWPEVNKETQARRLIKLEIFGHNVGPYPEIKQTPDDIPYALNLSEISKVGFEKKMNGTIKGKNFGSIEYYNSGNGYTVTKQTVKLTYKKFSDDGRNFYSGEEIFEGERGVKSVYISNVTLSGSESGKTDFKITFDNSGEIPKLIKGETEGYVSYRGKELRVDNYEE